MIFRGSGSIWTQTLYWLAEKFRMRFKSSANKVFEYGVVQALNSPSLCFVLLPTAGEVGRPHQSVRRPPLRLSLLQKTTAGVMHWL